MNVSEARALQLIGERLEVAVPRLHSHMVTNGITSIKMDFVEGTTLKDEWPKLSDEQKVDIAKQLRHILTALRSLKPESDPPQICAIGGGPILDLRVYASYTGGPFLDEAAFNDWLAAETLSGTPSKLLLEFRQRLPSTHRIVFTHGDLGQQNIIVRDNKVVALVDWESAGWFPEYWDFCKFFARSAASKDWFDYAAVIFPETYFDELLRHQFLYRYLRP